MYLWGSHLEGLEDFTHEFNRSIDFDQILFEEDIRCSLAHVKMLSHVGIINEKECEIISEALENIFTEIKNKTLQINLGEEDIHSFIENELTKRIGSVGKKLHTARSRNDQCALDLRLYSKKSLTLIKSELIDLIETIIAIAEKKQGNDDAGLHTHATRPGHHLCPLYFKLCSNAFKRYGSAYRYVPST